MTRSHAVRIWYVRVNVDLGHWDYLSTSFEITNAEVVSFQQTLFKLSQLKIQHPKDAVDDRHLRPPDTPLTSLRKRQLLLPRIVFDNFNWKQVEEIDQINQPNTTRKSQPNENVWSQWHVSSYEFFRSIQSLLFLLSANSLLVASYVCPSLIGLSNSLVNVLDFPREPGFAQSRTHHNSASLFWSGVPVSPYLFSNGKQ